MNDREVNRECQKEGEGIEKKIKKINKKNHVSVMMKLSDLCLYTLH